MMDECLACRACEAACPSGVPFGRMIEAARAQVEPVRPASVSGAANRADAGAPPQVAHACARPRPRSRTGAPSRPCTGPLGAPPIDAACLLAPAGGAPSPDGGRTDRGGADRVPWISPSARCTGRRFAWSQGRVSRGAGRRVLRRALDAPRRHPRWPGRWPGSGSRRSRASIWSSSTRRGAARTLKEYAHLGLHHPSGRLARGAWPPGPSTWSRSRRRTGTVPASVRSPCTTRATTCTRKRSPRVPAPCCAPPARSRSRCPRHALLRGGGALRVLEPEMSATLRRQ